MRNDHLSDEQIQEYLDGNTMNEAGGIRQHLESCTDCRKAFEDYRTLYTRLEKAPVWEPGSDFADSLIPLLLQRSRFHLPFYWVIGIISFLAFFGGVLISVGPRPLAAMVGRVFKSFVPLSKTISPFIGKLLERINGNEPLIIAAILALLTVAVVDHFFGRRLLRAAGARH